MWVRNLATRRRSGAGLVLAALSMGATSASGAAPAGLAGRAGQEAAEEIAALCGRRDVVCVDDTPGPGQEVSSIQLAVDGAGPGFTVLVFDGEYDGFRIRHGGAPGSPLRIAAVGRSAIVVGDEPVEGEDSIYIQNASYVTLEGLVIERRGRWGYGIGAHDALPTDPMRGLVIRNNVVSGAGSTNIYLSQVADSVIEGNVAHGSLDSHGIYLANAGSDNTVLRGNNCYDNAVNGIHFNGDQAETGDGLQSGLLVEGNIIHHNRANGLNMDGVQHSVVRNNLVFANGRHGLRAYAIDAADGPRQLAIINNTFVGNANWAVKLTEDGGRHTVFNNILLSAEGSLVADHPLLTSDHNIVVDGFSIDGERTVMGLARWQAAGFDRHSRVASASELFRAPGRDDFRLAPRSPAIDFGVFILAGQLAPEVDLAGQERPQASVYDAGAFEADRGSDS